MTPERWAAAQQLFEAALDRPAAERAAYVDASAPDAELAALVHGLLTADAAEQSGRPLTDVVKDAVADVTAAPRAPLERLGPYRLVSVLGEGGMGAVYLAERDDDEFLQQVAIKVVRGMLDPERVRQFRTERQILAWLEHPNIARLLDGGTAADGTPYLVMEHVEGVPIDRYADDAGLDVPARLRLFLTVCDAVSHAHRSLIVHRDIKPGNILVTAGGHVKLLDFGIARLALDTAAPEAAGVSQPRMMTPYYASPEVVRGAQVTTAADVYALGVLLHELLTGTRPLRFRTMTSEEVERVVCHVEPDAPSASAVAADDAALPPAERAARRGTTPAGLRRALAGDLDAIVAAALQKDVTARYASVEALAGDVRAHLERRPITVRTGWRYLGRRFVSRHRWGVGAAAVAVLAITTAAVVVSVQASRLAAERDRAARERDTAQQVLRFLTELFEVSNPDATPTGSTVTARELLDRGAARIDAELAGQPLVQARLMATIADVYGSLGAYAQSAGLLERSLQIRRGTLGADAPDTVAAMDALGEAYREMARFDDAERMHRAALDARRRAAAPATLIATSLNNLGLTLDERGDPADAEPLLREALALWRTSDGEQSEHVAIALHNLAAALRHQGRLADAVPLLEQSIAIRRRRVGEGHPALVPALGQLGQTLNQLGDLARAEPLLREALAIRQRVYGPDHPDTSTARNNLASLVHDLGDLAGAEALYRTALASSEARGGRAHPDYAVQLNNLGSLLEDRGRLQEAADLYRQSLEIRRRAYGPEHARVAVAEHNLGRVLLAMGRTAEAAAHIRTARRLREQLLPPTHYERGLSQWLSAELAAAEARPAEAAREFPAAVAALRASRGPDDLLVADVLVAHSAFLRRAGRAADAAPLAREALAIRRKRLQDGHWRTALAAAELAAVLGARGQQADAATTLTPAIATLAARLGEGDPRVKGARALLASLSPASQPR
jgi:serine/threonine-protein kinase